MCEIRITKRGIAVLCAIESGLVHRVEGGYDTEAFDRFFDSYEQRLKDHIIKNFEEAGGTVAYMCDPKLNTECPKRNCAYTAKLRPFEQACMGTLNEEYALRDKDGEPVRDPHFESLKDMCIEYGQLDDTPYVPFGCCEEKEETKRTESSPVCAGGAQGSSVNLDNPWVPAAVVGALFGLLAHFLTHR